GAWDRGEASDPVFGVGGKLGRAMHRRLPLLIGLRRERLGQHGIAASDAGGIDLRELLEKHIARPAVADDVMCIEYKRMVLGSKPDEIEGEQRRALELEGAGAFQAAEEIELGCTLSLVPGGKVEQRNFGKRMG